MKKTLFILLLLGCLCAMIGEMASALATWRQESITLPDIHIYGAEK